MAEVTHGMDATTTPAAARVARERRAHPNGWWGMALFICTEATLFGTLIASYFYLRFRSTQWPPPGVEEPKVAVPLIMMGVLVSTSLPIWLAVRASRAGRAGATWWLFFAALFVQAGYFAYQIHDYLDELHKFSPKDSAYGSAYFTLLGLHHVHVGVGMLLSLGLMARLPFGLTGYRITGVRAVAFYWYFVNAMAVAVVLTQIYPAL